MNNFEKDKEINNFENQSIKNIINSIFQLVLFPKFKKYKIVFSKTNQKRMKASMSILLKKQLILNNEMYSYPNFLKEVSDDVIEYCIKEYLEKNRQAISSKILYNEFEEPITDIIEKNMIALNFVKDLLNINKGFVNKDFIFPYKTKHKIEKIKK